MWHLFALHWKLFSFLRMPHGAELIALDAESGEVLWAYQPPTYDKIMQISAGDDEMVISRLFSYKGGVCCHPTAWGRPVISGDGTVYVPYLDGRAYVIRDLDGDGQIEKEDVSTYDFGVAFQ